ncbi:hypothetical protein [Radiobacillus sp. PE A8.2]|uniref:hypothetical protein n=1 Tax=Radiobacillus sp. PE A8.2 TaxID=3380349 RepID=UPI00388DA0BB
MNEFKKFLSDYIENWKNFSIEEIIAVESENYQAREVIKGKEIVDFGYKESIEGWTQAFTQLKEQDAV